MFARLLSAVVVGIDAQLVEVQCDVASGLPAFQVVGLPDKEVTESRERIRSAIKNSGYSFPAKRITANLAPADLRKEGVGFDLATALGILIASGQLDPPSARHVVLGELSLDGAVREVRGVLPIALASGSRRARRHDRPGAQRPRGRAGDRDRRLPRQDPRRGGGLPRRPSSPHARGRRPRGPARAQTRTPPAVDLGEIKGQEQAKRAAEIAAAGGHNLLLIGPPGAGKSLLARSLPGILPALSFAEALEVTRVYSIAGLVERTTPLVTQRPFRAPHHTISYAGMVGGGHGLPGPGEITLAHHGVLFLDELPEFDRRVLETLRQPLEDRAIQLARAGVSVRYPADFTLVGALNPCPCGHLGDHLKACTCSPHEIRRYRKRISGPFLDRIDLFVELPRLSPAELLARPAGETSSFVRGRVVEARRVQWERMKGQTRALFERAPRFA